MIRREVTAAIEAYNAGRDPERLALKYAALRKHAFRFLRGTVHLFWADVRDAAAFGSQPLAWACGDLHLENFGAYRGDDRLHYFDENDFDEAALAPCTADPLRLATSILVAASDLGVSAADARLLCESFLGAYAAALSDGKARHLEREIATGILRELLDGARERKRVALLESRTDRRGNRRSVRTDGKKALPASDAMRTRVEQLLQAFAATQAKPDFFKPVDVARRVAGTGSLGVDRFVILVEGKGSPDGNHLIDLKEARPSTLAANLANEQPPWRSEAERVVAVQRRMQAVSQGILHDVEMDGRSYVLRELQPSEDRLDLEAARPDELREAVSAMGRIVAWDQLRSSGRQGSAIADELIAFGEELASRTTGLVELAGELAAQVRADWEELRAASPISRP